MNTLLTLAESILGFFAGKPRRGMLRRAVFSDFQRRDWKKGSNSKNTYQNQTEKSWQKNLASKTHK